MNESHAEPEVEFSLAALSFGKIFAEEEKQWLPHYFVQRPEYQQVHSGDAWVILGQKGSGKSAIKVNLESEKDTNIVYIDISPDEMSWSRVTQFDHCGIKASQAKKNAWLAIFLKAIGDQIEVRAGHRYPMDSIREELIECGIERPDRMSLQEVSFHVHALSAKFGRSEAPDGKEFATVVSAVKNALRILDEQLRADGFRVRLLVDKLDEHWRAEREENLALEGLVLAAMFLAEETDNLRVQVFLRSDIWDTLKFHDKDKVMDSTIQVTWDEAAFVQLMAQRIRWSTRALIHGKEVVRPGNAREIFDWVFPAEIEGVRGPGGRRDCLSYLMSEVYHRPRDFIQFAQLATRERGDRSNPISAENIKKSLQKYSELRFSNLIDAETIATAPALELILKHIKATRTQAKIRWPTLEKKLLDAGTPPEQTAIYARLMIYYGVLGLARRDGSGRTAYYYDDHEIVRTDLASDTAFVFHPSFFRSLKLINIRGGIE